MICVGRRGEEAVSRKKDAHKATYRNSTEENKKRYKDMKSKAKKAVTKAMREKTEEAFTDKKIAQMGCLD